jgi:outer membrane protein assembly factor BamB
MAKNRTEGNPERSSRSKPSSVRLGLVVVLVVLILMLLTLGYTIFKVVLPNSGTSRSVDGDAAGGLEWVRSIYAYGPGEAQLMDAPVAAAIGGDGTIYAVDTQTNMVMAFNPDGSVRDAVNLVEATGSEVPHLGPKALMVAENGDVYVGASVGQAVFVLTPGLELIRWFPLEAVPYTLVQDGEELLISTDQGVLRFTDAGEFVGVVAQRGLGEVQVNFAQAMVRREDGVLFVADSMNGRVQAINSDGTLLWATALGEALNEEVRASAEGTGTSEFQVPAGIAIDNNGRIIVSDMQYMEMFVLDPSSGSVVGKYGEFGSNDGQFYYPMGLAYDSARDWFVSADMGNSRLQILRIPGSAPANVLAAARRSLVGPVWVCCLPPLLLLALLVAALRRRRTAERTEEEVLPLENEAV